MVLQAAQQPLPLKEIRIRIMEQGLVGTNARSSLETVMLRDAQKGSKRFVKLDGDLDVFRLMVRITMDFCHVTPFGVLLITFLIKIIVVAKTIKL